MKYTKKEDKKKEEEEEYEDKKEEEEGEEEKKEKKKKTWPIQSNKVNLQKLLLQKHKHSAYQTKTLEQLSEIWSKR